jgi:hypothetical protein
MFEFAVLRRTGNGEEQVDIGLLAETLLFYGRVHLLLDGGTLIDLIKKIGPDLLLELLKRDGVSASFLRETLGTVTHNNNGIKTYNFAQFRVDPPSKKGRVHISNDEWVAVQVERTLGASWKTRKFTSKLLKRISLADGKYPQIGGQDIAAVMHGELNNADLVEKAVRCVVATLVPSFTIPAGWHFRPLVLGDQFAIDTNFDFDRLNKEYHKKIPASHSSLSPEYLINHLLEARGAVVMGFKYLGELVIDPATSALIKQMAVELLRKRDAYVQELDLFQELHLPDGRKVRECLNSGERNFAEFLAACRT